MRPRAARPWRLAAGVVVLAALVGSSRAQAVLTFTPSGFTQEVVASGLPWATGIAFAPDGRMFIALKSGVVRVYQDGALLPTPFVDVSAHTADSGDRGLLGITVDPDFPSTPYVYLLYTWNPPGYPTSGLGGRVSRLIRVEADPAQGYNVAEPGSADPQTVAGGPGHVILLGANGTAANIGDPIDGHDTSKASCMTGLSMAGVPLEDCIPSDDDSHSIGTVLFGLDGTLFASSGDGANYDGVDHRALRSLDVDSLAGKIMRIDPVTGLGLPDNPFYDSLCPQCNRSKVYSLGLRNPFRFTIDPVTNEPYIGDVGWTSWEEIDTGKGAHFGWPCYEGGAAGAQQESGTTTSRQQGSYATNLSTQIECSALYAQGPAAVRAPVFSYSHGTDGTGASGGASANGGTFYTGSVYPSQYQNALFILDYNRRWVRYLTFDGQGQATVHNFGQDDSDGMVQVLSGPDTNLYVVVLNATGSEVRRIRYTAGGNTPPTALASATPTIGTVPLAVTFSSLGSFDPDPQPLSYGWTFGDGATSTNPNPSHTYTAPGVYTATLTVAEGTAPFASASEDVVITVGSEPPLATITTPANGTTYRIGDSIPYSGSGSSGGAPVDPSQLSWNLRLHHNEHLHFSPLPGGSGGTLDVVEHGDNTYFELCLTVTVPPTLTDTRCVTLLPETVPITLTTSPAGLFVNYEDEGLTQASPMIVTPVINSAQTVSVPLIQGGLTFDRWSDGVLANSHPFVVGPAPATYTAQYVNQPPLAVASATPLAGSAPLTVAFTGSGSSDPELGTLTYGWSFGDGSTSTQADPVYVYTAPGTYAAVLTVTDPRNGIATQGLSIVVDPSSASSSPITVWPDTTVPGSTNGADLPSELGVKFRSDVAGFISGVRFYKSANNTGTHVGNLWSATGTLLATAPFTSETTSGWQQVDFAVPIAIAANTTYVASYHCPNGFYSFDNDFFATQGVDAPPLHLLAEGVSGSNGVFTYSPTPTFPTSSYRSSNYWVDVVFTDTPPVLESIAVTPAGADLPAGTTQQFTATGTYAGGGTLNLTNQVTWASSSPAVATVDAAGLVTGVSVGSTNISATSGAVSGSTPLTVLPPGALIVTTTTLHNGAQNAPYAATLAATGGTPPYGWSIASGQLPAGLALAASTGVISGTPTAIGTSSFTVQATAGAETATRALGITVVQNEIAAENALTGNPASEWEVVGAGDPSIQGFAINMSVNQGATIGFKVDTLSTNYRVDIYRLGYYGGLGARRVATIQPSVALPQAQPECLSDATTGLVDCGNWALSASWAVPATATSGIYVAKLVREDPEDGRASHVPFVVRDDDRGADILFQTSDTTWQAYNTYGGNSLYLGSPAGRAYKVSYNRPFTTRCCVYPNGSNHSYLFNAEYPMVRWLERNGYDVSYASGIDADRFGAELLEHRSYMTIGHDEYWSGGQRANVEAARDAGVHMVFLAGNFGFWKTRWEPSIDGSSTPYRTLVSYKETHANAKIDPLPGVWTGTWRDPRFGPHDGGRPENALNGSLFTVNGIRNDTPAVPEADGKMRFWRNTSVATLAPGQTAVLPTGVLGFEWDEDLDNGFRPPGVVRLSTATVTGVPLLQDYGSTYASGTAIHHLTLYRHASGALVFGAGTVQWAWGLDGQHDFPGTPTDARIQQATVNLLADMNVAAVTLQAGLVPAVASTDATAPSALITSPSDGAIVLTGTPINITGTASDVGGRVGGVEVSTDGGATWHPATGRSSWSYAWAPSVNGSATLRARAVDDSGNLGAPSAAVTVTAAPAIPLSITVTPAAPTVAAGETQQFTATGTYTGGGTQDLTAQVTWASSSPAVATVSTTGLAAALDTGTSTISATLGAVSGGTLLTVLAPGSLVLTTTSLANGAQGTPYTATLAAVGGAPPYTWSLASGQLPAGLTLAPGTGVISGTPTTLEVANFTVQVSDGVETATRPLSIAIVPFGSLVTVWPGTTVPTSVNGPDAPSELGVKFRSDVSGYITAIRFYKWAGNTGTHVGNLWSSTGTPLATATFSNETSSGWQQVNFAAPVAIAANTTYVASYFCPNGFYAFDHFYFASQGVDAPPLHVPADPVAGGNGVFAYGATSTFPNQTYQSSNYWIDVVFSATAPLQSIAVTPPAPAVVVGGAQQFTATGTLFGGSTQDLTNQVAWASSNPVAATVGTTGLATTLATGTSIISATLGAISGNASLSVLPPTLLVTTTSLPNGTRDTGYTANLAASGGTPPYTWSIASGQLPVGLSLATGTGVISGTPTAAELASFTAQVSDGTENATRPLSITIAAGAECSDGVDSDGDGLVDHPDDPGCASPDDLSERGVSACDDGADNDGDDRADFDPATFADPQTGSGDPGCVHPASLNENPACQDGLNNDGQPGTDFDGGQSIYGACTGVPGGCPPGVSDPEGDGVANPDPQCAGRPWWTSESTTTPGCGLGTELALLLPLLRAWRRRVRAAASATA